MKHIFCIMLSFLLLFSLCACGAETVYFDEEMKAEENYIKQATAHFPQTFGTFDEATLLASVFTVSKDGHIEGTYSEQDYSEKGDEYPFGTFYNNTFAGDFSNYEIISDYEIKMFCHNFSTEQREESIDSAEGVRHATGLPKGFRNGEKGYTLYTPEAPVSAVPQEILGRLPYGTSGNIGVYIIYNNATGECFSSADTSPSPQY